MSVKIKRPSGYIATLDNIDDVILALVFGNAKVVEEEGQDSRYNLSCTLENMFVNLSAMLEREIENGIKDGDRILMQSRIENIAKAWNLV